MQKSPLFTLSCALIVVGATMNAQDVPVPQTGGRDADAPRSEVTPVPPEPVLLGSVKEFNGEDLDRVLLGLARQAKINMVVSDQVAGTMTLRLTDVTALKALEIITTAKGLYVTKINEVYFVKTAAERDQDAVSGTPVPSGTFWDDVWDDGASPGRVFEVSRENQGVVLRELARQAKINLVVSDQVAGMVTLRLTDVTVLRVLETLAKFNGWYVTKTVTKNDGIVYFVKTAAERDQKPAKSNSEG